MLNYSVGLNQELLETIAGDAAAGGLVGGERSVVLVGEVDEAVDFRGLL